MRRHTSGVLGWARLLATASTAAAVAVALCPPDAAWGLPASGSAYIFFDSSRSGRYAIYVKTPDGAARLLVHDRGGADFAPALSPRGHLVAYTRRIDGNYDLYTADLTQRTGRTRLTKNPAIDAFPSWSPIGQLAFESNRRGNYDIYVYHRHQVRQLTTSSSVDGLPAWSPDGRLIAFDSNRSGHFQIMLIRPSGATSATALTATASNNVQPAWSPDSTRIAFTSDRSGRYQIYILTVASGALTRVTDSTADDVQPAWTRSGDRLAFLRMKPGKNRLFTVNPDGSGIAPMTDNRGELPEWSVDS
jgi:Tol biopolymer transport system component